ncbi:MAG: translation initiation factor [Lasallia pustulata]|uniref:Translation initiation factor n=1 Tax=Lasallia pustulata TaxID=136370 RepID=A0A5M8PHG0_9LECA|nr:MAG: translation initiation factor [Lasallia pustulata]
MASKKDMRREDLVIPYVSPEKDKDASDMASTMANTLPMAAMFTRNKMIGWSAVVFALQTWLAETPEQRKNASTPGYYSVGMAFMSLVITYLPLFLPPPPQAGKAGTSTGAPPAAPAP